MKLITKSKHTKTEKRGGRSSFFVIALTAISLLLLAATTSTFGFSTLQPQKVLAQLQQPFEQQQVAPSQVQEWPQFNSGRHFSAQYPPEWMQAATRFS